MMKDGFLLALHPSPNWTAQVRARPHRLRTLPATRPYYNLMAPIPARGHIVHWLFEAVVPLLTYLESGGRDMGLGLIVNAERSGIQQTTLNYFKERYGIDAIEPLGPAMPLWCRTSGPGFPRPRRRWHCGRRWAWRCLRISPGLWRGMCQRQASPNASI